MNRIWGDTLTLIAVLFIAIIMISGCGKGEGANPPKTETLPSHANHFVSRDEMYKALASKGHRADFKGRVKAGVVPHHLLAGALIGQTMETMASQDDKVIVLVGPNHNNLGAKVITGLYGWQTPEGIVQTDKTMVENLITHGLAIRDEAVLSQEHSIGTLVPFIKHFLPQARVVPIILHHDVSLKEVEALLDILEPYLDQDGIIISSVDFSHYLTRREAQEKDVVTLELMRNFDYTTLFNLGNDHLDSPASLSMALKAMERRGLRDFQLLANTNSGIILKNDVMETTSYFTLIFAEE